MECGIMFVGMVTESWVECLFFFYFSIFLCYVGVTSKCQAGLTGPNSPGFGPPLFQVSAGPAHNNFAVFQPSEGGLEILRTWYPAKQLMHHLFA